MNTTRYLLSLLLVGGLYSLIPASAIAQPPPADYTITATAGANGAITPSGAVSVTPGSDREFVITPNTGYSVADVHVDTVSVGAVGSYTFTNVSADHTIEAFFAIQTFTVTSSAGPNGSITPAGDSTVNYGASIAYTITPAPGYFIADVHVDTLSVGPVGTYTFLNVTADHTIEAFFAQLRYTLSVTAIGPGTIIKTPDQASYLPGVSVQIGAIPSSPGWIFSHWECDTSGSANPLTFQLYANKNITAVFLPSGGQFVQQGGKLVGAGAAGSAFEGMSVSVSDDGSTAVVGGSGDNGGAGGVWVYTRCAGLWSQQGAKLVGTGAVGNARQGQSVSLSADGNTLLVGGYADNGDAGAAWVFTRSEGAWSQQGIKLVGTGAIGNARQGYAVALSADGNTAIVGGYLNAGGTGAVWVFTRSGGTWSQQGGQLVGSGAVGLASQGRSVALSANGNTAIVGGYADKGSLGAAWVFIRTAGVWSQQGNKLVGSAAVGNARQGQSVSISADGNTAIVGGYTDDGDAGAAWIFTRSGTLWSQQGNKLVGTGAVGRAQMGYSVSLSGDGNKAVVGGYSDNGGKGAVWIYTRSAGVWSQQGGRLVGTGAVDPAGQGSSVALSGNGRNAVVGAYGDAGNTGAAWVYTLGLQTFTITSTAGPNGTITPLGISMVNFGGSLTYVITPDAGYSIADVHVDTISAGPVGSYTFSNVMANHSIEAFFELAHYTLNVTVLGQGTVTKDPDLPTYLYGTSVVLNATPSDTTWLFSRWIGDAGGSDNPLTLAMNSNKNITAVFSRIPSLAAMYRSFLPESLANERDEKGKPGRYIKRKPWKSDFQCYLTNPYPSEDMLTVTFKNPIDGAFPFGTIPPSTAIPVDERRKRWMFLFPVPLHFNDTVRIYGTGSTGSFQRMYKYGWSNGGPWGSSLGAYGIFERNILLLPMPNRMNLLSEIFAQGGFAGTGGLLVGRARTDNPRYYGWLLAATYTDVFKTLNYRYTQHSGLPRGLDYFASGRPIMRRHRSIQPTKHNNRLLANLVALKVAIVSSAMEKTQLGFGELIYDDGTTNPLNGLMVKEISAIGDSLMMGYYQYGVHTFESPGVFLNLDTTVRRINASFEGPMDTIAFAQALILKGTRELGEVTYLRPNPMVMPDVIKPVGSPFEQVPEDYALYQNYPNPFNPVTTIAFDLPEESRVTISVYDMLGQRVTMLAENQEFDAGGHDVEFDASQLASGIYLYRLEASGIEGSGRSFVKIGKMVLLK